jgi:ribonuclease III
VPLRVAEVSGLEAVLEVAFGDRDLLRRAVVRRSYLNENPGFGLGSNERLEFLGDAFLGYSVATRLYRDDPEAPEGQLTQARAALVRSETLARVAGNLQLGRYLFLGKGEEATGGRLREANLAGALEAVIGAVLVDRGSDEAEDLVWRLLQAEWVALFDQRLVKDAKTRLQELTQSRWSIRPVYRMVPGTGPEHGRVFAVEVTLEGAILGRGRGRSKQEAEQMAAAEALVAVDSHA